MKDAYNATPVHCATDTGALARLVKDAGSVQECVLIDLSNAGEMHGIVDDVKQLTGKFRVIVLGTEQEIGSLPKALHESINGFLVAPTPRVS